MSEQTANLCTTDACEVLRARLAKYEDAEGRPVSTIAEQAQQIQRLQEGQESLILVRDDYKKQAHYYRARWASAIASGNAPVGAIEAIRAEFPLFDDTGIDQETHHCEWSVQHDRKRLHALLAALKAQPCGVDERAAFEAHMRVGGYSNPDKHPDGSYVSSAMELWWQGWQARAALTASAPSHGEQVRDVSAMARVLSDRQADACNVDRDDQWKIYGQDFIEDVTAMLAAAPSAGSQGGDV